MSSVMSETLSYCVQRVLLTPINIYTDQYGTERLNETAFHRGEVFSKSGSAGGLAADLCDSSRAQSGRGRRQGSQGNGLIDKAYPALLDGLRGMRRRTSSAANRFVCYPPVAPKTTTDRGPEAGARENPGPAFGLGAITLLRQSGSAMPSSHGPRSLSSPMAPTKTCCGSPGGSESSKPALRTPASIS